MVYNTIAQRYSGVMCHIFIPQVILYISLLAEDNDMTNSYVPEGRLFGTAENTELTRNESGLRTAWQSGKILEGIAAFCDSDLDLHIDLGAYEGVIPHDEALFVSGGDIKDIAVISRVGKPVCFIISELATEGGKKTAYLSRAAAQKECIDRYLSYFRCGDIIGCRVTHTERFGAFTDVGCGVSALLPVDRISVSRISHASDRVRTGDDIRCAVCRIEQEPFRMFLSLKELLGTWNENAKLFSAGQTVRGVVRGVEPYGVFIELSPNLAGLSEYRGDVEPGDEVAVYIKSIDERKMKVKLVIVGVQGKARPLPIRYFISDKVSHIYSFIYSTPSSQRMIHTDFT